MSTKKLQVIDYTVKQAENADTVDNKHASDFASAVDMTTAQSNISDLQTKVGDTAVSSQISSAINAIDYPVDSVNGKTGAVTLTATDVGALPADTSIPSISGLATETYVNNKVAGIVDTAPEALDTLNELAAALGDDPNFATTVATQIGTKVDKVDGKGLSTNDYTTAEKTKLAGIETGANKTTVDSALSSTSTNPVQNKVVNSAISNLNTLVGDTAVATQITNAIANKVDKVSGKGLSTNDYTTDEKTKLSGIASGAEVNQNAFSNVVIGGTTIAADGKTDTLTLVAGDKIILAPDATNDKITISATETVHSNATVGSDGFMSSSDKIKLDGIESGATKTIIDSALSSTSTNPVQNKVVNTAITNLNTLVGDTAVSTQITNAIADKSDVGHTHSEYVNQNAFSNVVVDTTTIAADAVTDTLTLAAGDNITITPDATNDKITIAAKDTVYTHPSYTATTGVPTANAAPAFGGTFNVSQPVSDATGHITAINSRTVTIPSTAATTSAAGLMSASDKTKLDGIATGATKVTVDSALSSTSTNPVQNKVINTALNSKSDSTHNHSGVAIWPVGVELSPTSTSAGNGGYIDFHYNANTSVDYTSRIIESPSGTVQLNGSKILTGNNIVAVYNTTLSFSNGVATYSNSAIKSTSVVFAMWRAGSVATLQDSVLSTTSGSGSVTIISKAGQTASNPLNILILNL